MVSVSRSIESSNNHQIPESMEDFGLLQSVHLFRVQLDLPRFHQVYMFQVLSSNSARYQNKTNEHFQSLLPTHHKYLVFHEPSVKSYAQHHRQAHVLQNRSTMLVEETLPDIQEKIWDQQVRRAHYQAKPDQVLPDHPHNYHQLQVAKLNYDDCHLIYVL